MKDYEYRDENGNYLDYYTILEDNKKMTKELEELEIQKEKLEKRISDLKQVESKGDNNGIMD